MTWLSNLFNFLALNVLRLFAFLPYGITIYFGYGLGWLPGLKRVLVTMRVHGNLPTFVWLPLLGLVS